MDMTLKVRLAAMMILMLIAVMALQYILTQREQAELRRQIALASAEVNSSAREVSYWVGALTAEGETDLPGRLMQEFGERGSHSRGESDVTVRIVHESAGPGTFFFTSTCNRSISFWNKLFIGGDNLIITRSINSFSDIHQCLHI